MSPISAEHAAAKLKAFSEQFERKPDGCVYHYTNLGGLANIIASEALCCSDYRQLNDRTEFKFGMEVLEVLVATRAAHLGLSQEHTRKMLEHLAQLRQGNFHMSIFCASWCLWPDDLTLWRSYAPQDGVSIGFSLDELSRLAKQQGFACGAVRYYDAQHFGAWFDEQQKGGSLIKRVVVGPSPRAVQNFEAAARLGHQWGFEVVLPEHAFVS